MLEIIKDSILPSNLIILFFILGIALLFIRRMKRFAFSSMMVAGILYILFGTGPISFWLLGNLEYRYPPLESLNELKTVRKIVVLTGYAELTPGVPLSSEVNSASMYRIVEAVRISKEIPGARILISGKEDVPEIMRNLILSLGIMDGGVMIENGSNSTYESAKNLQRFLESGPFILVTSAGHMVRAMGAFRKQGMNPIPAPTQFFSRKNYLAVNYLPSPIHLEYSDLAIHEYVGILWYLITNRM